MPPSFFLCRATWLSLLPDRSFAQNLLILFGRVTASPTSSVFPSIEVSRYDSFEAILCIRSGTCAALRFSGRLTRSFGNALAVQSTLVTLFDSCRSKTLIERTKRGLLNGSSRWILGNPDFQRWRYEQGRLLWIKGDAGKGKMMLMVGIIDELLRQVERSEQSRAAETLSYMYSCCTMDVTNFINGFSS